MDFGLIARDSSTGGLGARPVQEFTGLTGAINAYRVKLRYLFYCRIHIFGQSKLTAVGQIGESVLPLLVC
ncbi:MAG: hypothetical protein MUF49_29520 [Oculatellaceae cyanobacterium Prado106]|nr:hypothetical protein [Oculatellaceae cyanobacterium Prado106]